MHIPIDKKEKEREKQIADRNGRKVNSKQVVVSFEQKMSNRRLFQFLADFLAWEIEALKTDWG